MTARSDTAVRAQITEAIRQRRRFIVTSHVRPDGDAIGSQLAMACALRSMGKDVRVINRDPAPAPFLAFPGVASIELADRVESGWDAAIVMECGDIARTGLEGLERGFVINIDHHQGNTAFGALNWIDLSAAACGEMVFDAILDLGVPLTREMATHIYIAILTDTGSFHYSAISPRTFEICRQVVEAGVDPPAVARAIYDHNSLGRLRLLGAVLNGMELDGTRRLATLMVNRALALDLNATYEDTDGLINLPLTVGEIQAVLFFKESGPDEWRVSMRSKGEIDINAVAKQFGGGGHKNASGCTVHGKLADLKGLLQRKVLAQVDAVAGAPTAAAGSG
jgi:phosphoesterase RecJ-like protein